MIPIILINCVLFFIFFMVGKKIKTNYLNLIIFVFLFFIALLNVAYYAHLFDNYDFYFNYRTHALADFIPSFSGFLVGYSLWISRKLYKVLTFGALLLVSVFAIVGPWVKLFCYPTNYEALHNRWVEGVCMQSTLGTCGPCSLANVLKYNGLTTSESELAKEAFTCATGTESWYLARCAKRRQFKTKFIFNTTQIEKNSIIGISMGSAGHFIAVLEDKEGVLTIADSLTGIQKIERENFNQKYKFKGMSLILSKN